MKQELISELQALYKSMSACTDCFESVHENKLLSDSVEEIFSSKQKQIKPYTKLGVFINSLESAIHLAFCYQEIIRQHDIIPEVIMFYKGRNYLIVSNFIELCKKLYIPDEALTNRFSALASATPKMQGNMLFVVPERLSATCFSGANAYYCDIKGFDFGMYVFTEDFSSLMSGDEYSPEEIVLDLYNAVLTTDSDNKLLQKISQCRDIAFQEDDLTCQVMRRKIVQAKTEGLAQKYSDILQTMYSL